jgi:hypothetical protein
VRVPAKVERWIERAAIKEYHGNQPRLQAEVETLKEIKKER